MVSPIESYTLDELEDILGYSKTSISKKMKDLGCQNLKTSRKSKFSGYEILKYFGSGLKTKEEIMDIDNLEELEHMLLNEQLVVNTLKKRIKSLS